MITFTVTKDDKQTVINISNKENILSLKNKIIDSLNLNEKYIDIYINIDKPIRVFGKFNLEPGLLPRSFDNYSLDKWGIDEKNINIEYKEIFNYTPTIKKPFIKKTTYNKYKCPGTVNIESGTSYTNAPTYDLQSNNDFPLL